MLIELWSLPVSQAPVTNSALEGYPAKLRIIHNHNQGIWQLEDSS